MSQADCEPLSASWSQPAWSSGCPTGTHCAPPKPHKLAKQLPICSVHLTRLLPGGSYFYFYTSLTGPRHPTAARWNKQFNANFFFFFFPSPFRLALDGVTTWTRQSASFLSWARDPSPTLLGLGTWPLVIIGPSWPLPRNCTLRSSRKSTCLATLVLPSKPWSCATGLCVCVCVCIVCVCVCSKRIYFPSSLKIPIVHVSLSD